MTGSGMNGSRRAAVRIAQVIRIVRTERCEDVRARAISRELRLVRMRRRPSRGFRQIPGFRYWFWNEDIGVPLLQSDIPERPNTVFGEVLAGVHKTTVFRKQAPQSKIWRELRGRAE
jgi:hypothetical protein